MTWRRRISSFDIVDAPDEDVLAEVLRRQLGEDALHQRGHLLRRVPAAEVLVPLPLHVGDPVGGALGDDELQAREALERAAEQEVPHRAGGPPHDLGQVDADVVVHLLARRLARVGVHREARRPGTRPTPGRRRVVVGRAVPPHRRDHHAADAGLVGQPLDLRDARVDVVGDRHEPDAAPALGAVAHSSTRKRLWARAPAKASSGSSIIPADRPAPNGGDSMPVMASASGKITSADDAVGVHLLVALLGVERAAQTLLVLGLPARDVVVVELQGLVAVALPLGEERVELLGGTARRGRAGTPRTAARRGSRPR